MQSNSEFIRVTSVDSNVLRPVDSIELQSSAISDVFTPNPPIILHDDDEEENENENEIEEIEETEEQADEEEEEEETGDNINQNPKKTVYKSSDATNAKTTTSHNPEWGKKLTGLFCLAVVIVDWIAMSVILGSYKRLIFTRYIVQSAYMVLLIPYAVVRVYHYCLPSSSSPRQLLSSSSTIVAVTIHENKTASANSPTERETDLKGIVKWSFIFVVLNMVCGYAWYLSLTKTNFAVNNTIYQSQCVIVYVLSAMFLGTQITWQKSLAVVLSTAGVGIISFSSSQSSAEDNTPFGLAMCVVSMFLYSIIELICSHVNKKFFNPKHSVRDSMLFQGLSGVICLFTLWIVVLAAHFLGWEDYEWPSTETWISILTLGALSCLFFFSFLVGTVCTSAVFMATGSLIVIPMSFIVDVIRFAQHPNIGSIMGALMICIGFLLMELPISQYLSKNFGFKGDNLSKDNKKKQEFSNLWN